MTLFMTVKIFCGLGILVASMFLSACTYTVYLPDDEDSNSAKGERVTTANPEFGNQCRYGGNGEYGVCPTSNGEIVGTSCSCPTPSGQIMGTVSKY